MFLGIDTSLGTAVAGVEDDGAVISEAVSTNPLGHAEVIGDLLATILAESEAAPTHVAAGMGPGPFTGLRVGIAAARAFALGRSLPVVPVVSHDAVALELLLHAAMTDVEQPRFAVVTDARRREFAFSVYEGLDDDGLPVRTADPQLVARDELEERLALEGASRIDAEAVSAAFLAICASRAVAAGRTIGPAEPLYLRAPDVTLGAPRKRVIA